MTKKTLKKFLKEHEACVDVYRFAKDLTLEEFLETCPRGDWILWLFQKSNSESHRELILVKAHCANTVCHLMKDERSKEAVNVAILFGVGHASDQELAAAYAAAAAAAADATYAADAYADAVYATAAYSAAAYAAAAATAADAAYSAAAYAATAYAADAYAADAYAADAAVYATAKRENEKQTADICRKYLKVEIWNIRNKKRKTRSDKGKPRKKNRKVTTHIRVEVDKKPFIVKLARMPIEFFKKILGEK